MPEIKEVPYLKPDDVPENQSLTLTFLAPHEDVPAAESGLDKDLTQILVELPNQQKRVWTMNKTSQRIIVGLHGSNSDKWVGKKVNIYALAQNISGSLKRVVYAKGDRVE